MALPKSLATKITAIKAQAARIEEEVFDESMVIGELAQAPAGKGSPKLTESTRLGKPTPFSGRQFAASVRAAALRGDPHKPVHVGKNSSTEDGTSAGEGMHSRD